MTDSREATVLVVDDEASLADLYTEHLETAGHTVKTAYNGGEAILELDAEVEVVFLDRQMPGMRGDEVLSEIRDWFDWCRVVMVTAVDPDFDLVDLQFDEYLTKPVTRAELLETTEQMLMLDEYDELFNEYRSLTKRVATLKSSKTSSELRSSDDFQELERRRGVLRDRIAALIEGFSDPEFTAAFNEIHSLGVE
jgi:CheY-like chemotaxis protein